MEKVEFKNSQGLKIAGVLDSPQKGKDLPIVICLHGLGGTKESNKVFTDILSPLGIASLSIDFQGSGESEGEYENKTITGFVDDAQSALDYVYSLPNVDKNRIGVVGHSMGAVTAILLASRDPRIKALVVSSPAIKEAQVIADMYEPNDFAKAKERGYVELRKSGEMKKLNYRFFEDADQYDLIQEALKISYKFLVIGAVKDTIVPFKQIKEFSERVGNAQLLKLPNSDHNLEEEWSITGQAIRNWFENWLKVV
jgi:pimeloyl-ACP methyl ester carboxylesterase